jgi:hypothetical protein
MKTLAVLLVLAFAATSLMGCSKKKKDDSASMDGLNGVVSENVISVSDIGANSQMSSDIPVVIDNAESAASEMALDEQNLAADATSKPTPKQIQQALKNAGLYTGKIDGELGPRTKKAIETFQSQNGLKADGKVGAKTWRVLSSYLQRPGEVSNPTNAVQTVGE